MLNEGLRKQKTTVISTRYKGGYPCDTDVSAKLISIYQEVCELNRPKIGYSCLSRPR